MISPLSKDEKLELLERRSKYAEIMSKVRNYILVFRNGVYADEPEVLVEIVERGFCVYDKCPVRRELSADRRIWVLHDTWTDAGRLEIFHLHGACIEDVLKDPRFEGLN